MIRSVFHDCFDKSLSLYIVMSLVMGYDGTFDELIFFIEYILVYHLCLINE